MNIFNFVRRSLLQNFHKLNKLQVATVAYQFKMERPVYYPDRQSEMQRFNEQQKSQLVGKAQEKKKLPRDYYYKILGVKRYATMQQIKAAYYALAKRFHPDAGNSPPYESKRFQDISNAYHILTDETKRMEYDQLGMVKDEQNFLHKFNNMGTAVPNRKGEVVLPTTREELIEMTTGEPRLELTFLEAAHGLKKNIDLRFLKKCPACNGKSPQLINRSKPELCRKCQGIGKLTKKTATYTSIQPCDQCHGKRYINRNECETCDNRGIVLETVRIVAQVPAGVKHGELIPVDNPKTKQRINYRVQVQPSDIFQRVGNNVLSDKYITISEAVLGGIFKIRGIYEELEVKLEPGTESHTTITLKGKGIRTRDGPGDHIINFKIRVPRQLSMKQRQLIMALAKTEDPTFERAI
ncbi:PREDICTED: protein tumorous imaginal discs, mitochondrial [Rhagoletis zephyria]|uniref:protein tumorous imaginal discs, mitochondrial n=1 Tax=Rhagoletis zephyria TaxID=28612 RepID=UPI0008115DF8|nr:PREDICTED: protein tumorous imaginal discs, mitochondrial [Rhagoletis zephyria]XP_036336054.1 protein tumorous imaginal discs, mitochondrial-like [Rhagoletis pomonella]